MERGELYELLHTPSSTMYESVKSLSNLSSLKLPISTSEWNRRRLYTSIHNIDDSKASLFVREIRSRYRKNLIRIIEMLTTRIAYPTQRPQYCPGCFPIRRRP